MSMGVLLVGDIVLSGLYLIDENNDERFQKLRGILPEDFIMIGNLETPVAENLTEVEKARHNLVTDEEVLIKFITRLNLNVVSIANNHILDLKEKGFLLTVGILEKNAVKFNGAGIEETKSIPTVFNYKKNRIGFIAFVHEDTNPSYLTDHKIKLNLYNKDNIIQIIKRLKKEVDFIIVSLHWGKDYSTFPEEWQVNDAREFVNAGANIIMGHHPHTIQPYEKYGHGHIFYSLGGLTFGDFFWENQLRALKRKTKKSFIPVFKEINEDPEFICIKELKGNFIEERRNNIKAWSKRIMFISSLSYKYQWVNAIVRFKESFIDRLYEFVFGYYRNPIREIFRKSNYSKIKYISRDFKKSEYGWYLISGLCIKRWRLTH